MIASPPRTVREPTDPTRQRNRCPRCGHRLSVALGRRCAIVTGDGRNASSDRSCSCRRHYRNPPRLARPRAIPRRAIGRCTHRLLGEDGLTIVGVCSLPLRFHGLRGDGERVERWYVGACGFYTVLNALGTVERITNQEPRRGYYNHNHDECKKHARNGCVAG